MIRIEEALARSKANGNKILKKDIAARLWPGSSPAVQGINMRNLCNGLTSRITVEWVNIICEMTGCSADFLFGLSNE